ncbi:hypothetical protein ACIGEP_15500 [Microbacterium sp. NPDC077663]|uniref:hypothetical protein n=1 Tax=Microbacterium sp. NPDC077663 TaxID=3364189 RepID=UPI0037C5C181
MGIDIIIRGSGPGDGPKDPPTWTPGTLGGLIKTGGVEATLAKLATTDPAGRPLIRLDRTDTDETQAYAFATVTAADRPAGFSILTGQRLRIFGYVRASRACDLVAPQIVDVSNGNNSVHSVPAIAITSGSSSYTRFDFEATAVRDFGSTQGVRWGARPSGQANGPHAAPLRLDIGFSIQSLA